MVQFTRAYEILVTYLSLSTPHGHIISFRWIGDGRFFAVSAIDPAVGTRKIRIWTRDGILHSTSEVLTGLEGTLDWR